MATSAKIYRDILIVHTGNNPPQNAEPANPISHLKNPTQIFIHYCP